MKNKYIIGVVLAAILFLCAKPTTADFMSEEDKTVTVADILHQSVVKISDDNGTGTGFYISKDEVISNEHVTHDAKLITLTKYSGQTCLGVVEKDSKYYDLSLIKSYCDGMPLKLAQIVKVGQSLVMMGNPISQSFFLSKGIVSNLLDGYVLTDSYIDHGSSGSPMVNLNGEVVGVVVGVYHDTNIGAGKDLQSLNQFMKGD